MEFLFARSEEIKSGKTTDIYFERTLKVLERENLASTEVYAEVTASAIPHRYKWVIYAGLREALTLLEGRNISVYSIPECTLFYPVDVNKVKTPVLAVEGPYEEFAVFETALLGFLASASGGTTKAARVKKAACNRPVLSFGARRTHPAIAPFVDYYAYIGGCDGVSCVKGAELLNIAPSGTMPHSLMIIFRAVKGNHVEAWIAFDKHVEPEVPRIVLADTFWDETEETLKAAEKLGTRLWGVRLDTPSSRRGDIAAIVREVKWKLRTAGYNHVRVVVSGGLDENVIPELIEAGADAFGVGSAIANAPYIDYAMDITAVKVKGEWIAISKRGKFSGRKQVYRCWNCLKDMVTLAEDNAEKCPSCGGPVEPLLTKVMEVGRILIERELPENLRKRVLTQIQKVEL
ncbi:MAG: nicotinate phosphoribosyltransferase [Thermofilaceae archaeon]